MKARIDIIDRRDEIIKWTLDNLPNAEIARRLKCKVQTLTAYYKKLDINYRGNQGAKGVKISTKKKSALDIISNPNISNARKRRKLIEDGLKEKKCEYF